MDTAISNGDFLLDSRGRPIIISDFDEVLQQVMIRLKIKYGSFVYHKELGSEIYNLKNETENLNNKALAIVRRAIVDMCGVEANKAVVFKSDGNMTINVEISSGEESGEVELII